MKTNMVPEYDMSDNPTGCCPRFHPEVWKDVELHFRDKSFVRAETRSVMHVPLNMGKVFGRVMGRLGEDFDKNGFITLSRDPSPWRGEHLFAADRPVEGEEMVTLSGDYITRVFEGPFSDAGAWHREMKEEAAQRGRADGEVWFYYTTCPKCAKVYGKNYVVGIAEV
jgi:hypothetical protein